MENLKVTDAVTFEDFATEVLQTGLYDLVIMTGSCGPVISLPLSNTVVLVQPF